MNVLLDTCTFLWIVSGARELSRGARLILDAPENVIFLSAASTWEIALKHSLGDLPMPQPPERFVPEQRERHGIDALPIEEMDTLQIHRIPRWHKDPFDRILVCQAIARGMTILTPDEQIARYPVRTAW